MENFQEYVVEVEDFTVAYAAKPVPRVIHCHSALNHVTA